MPRTAWMCVGDVRGECGVRHLSYEASAQHCRKDDRNCKRGFGRDAYSDRAPKEMPHASEK